jgi:peptidoglycan/LPS O-acetylase OafA/YrhL
MLKDEIISPHIAPLDGLRAIAILLVILVHSGLYFILDHTPPVSIWGDIIANGRSGVDLFFVLSGFLITGILLDTRERSDYFPRFYWRRALRIWPLYYAFLFAAYWLHPAPFNGLHLRPFALYYRNFLGPDYASDVYFGQFWSLCVEEQFYLVWPFVVYFLPRVLRLPLTLAMIVGALIIRIELLRHGVSPYVVYRLPWCRMDGLAAGATVAILFRHSISTKRLQRIFMTSIAIAMGILIYVGRYEAPGNGPRFDRVGVTGYALLYGGIVGFAVLSRGSGRTIKLLSSRFCRAIATRSYAMYLFHLVPLYVSVILLSRWKKMPQHTWTGLLAVVAIAAVAYGMAWISWRYFEAPILRLKQWEWYRKKTPPASDTPQAA